MAEFSETLNFGYDTDVPEPLRIVRPELPTTSLSSFQIDASMLPPPGAQGTAASPGFPGSCAAWASTYGLATVTAAINGRVDPSQASGQASPAFIYINVLKQHKHVTSGCSGSVLAWYTSRLTQHGTASMQSAPYIPNCPDLWSTYNGATPAIDQRFQFPNGVTAFDPTNLDDTKSVLASNRAIAYGTALDKGFEAYDGPPVPYVGSGQVIPGSGHCMLIIGFDDACGPNGALWIQNSMGTGWGNGGRFWMDYNTFLALSQSVALYAN